MFLTGDSLSPATTAGEERMETPEDVAVMLRLAELGWGSKRIAAELGCSRATVKRYLQQGGWTSYRGRGRPSALAGLEGWLAERFRRHRGNADVVRQELAREHGVRVSLRRSSGRWRICDVICLPRRGPACASRRCPAGSCRSTSARPSCRSPASGYGSICSWRLSDTRAAASWPRFGTSGNRLGSRAWRGPSATLAECRARSCSTMPSRSSFATMPLRARSCSTSGCTPLRATGHSRGPVRADQGQGRERRRLAASAEVGELLRPLAEYEQIAGGGW